MFLKTRFVRSGWFVRVNCFDADRRLVMGYVACVARIRLLFSVNVRKIILKNNSSVHIYGFIVCPALPFGWVCGLLVIDL